MYHTCSNMYQTSNAEYSAFVQNTSYVTDSELFGW